MKIYLAAAIRGGRSLQATYQAINEYLQENGHNVLTHHVASANVTEIEETMSDTEIYTQAIKWLDECDALIGEVSIPSLGVGYEIAYTLGLDKPVLGLFEENRVISAMIAGNTSPGLTLRSYRSIPNLFMHIKTFLTSL